MEPFKQRKLQGGLSMKGLDQKVAIVTGAAAGMGKVTAQRFVEEGTKVIASDLQKDKLEKVVNELNEKYNKKSCNCY
jgi:NADP-dependent 3-hydroxy acid dehydrogenase YdfG